MSGKTKVLLNSGLYTVSSVLISSMSFLLLPFYTMFLTPDDYGITNLISSFTVVASLFVSCSLHASVVRFYTEYKQDKEKLRTFYGTVIIFILFSGSGVAIIGAIFQEELIRWLFSGLPFYPYVMIAFLNMIFISQHSIHQRIMQSMHQGKKYTLINLIVFACTVGLNILFLTVYRLGAAGVLLSSLLINISYFIFMIFDLRKNDLILLRFDAGILKEALRYSVPLMPHNLSSSIASWVSRLVLGSKSSLAFVGLYSVASQFGSIIDTIQASVNSAFAPWFYEVMSEGNAKSKQDIVDLSKVLLIGYSLLYILIGLFSQEAILIMTSDRYAMAWMVIPILIAAFSIKSIYYFYVNILFYYKKAVNKVFIATLTGNLADICFALVLIPRYHMYGSAVAFLIAKIISVVIVVALSKHYDDVGYKMTDMLRIIIPSLLFMGLGLFFSYTVYTTVWNWGNIMFKIFIFFVYVGYLYLMNKKAIDAFAKSETVKRMVQLRLRTKSTNSI